MTCDMTRDMIRDTIRDMTRDTTRAGEARGHGAGGRCRRRRFLSLCCPIFLCSSYEVSAVPSHASPMKCPLLRNVHRTFLCISYENPLYLPMYLL
eukprot:135352-Rhodomonas_salina.2